MCNCISAMPWQPVEFEHFASPDAVPLLKNTQEDKPDVSQRVSESPCEGIDEKALQTQLMQVVSGDREAGYQEGLRIGKEEGMVIGREAGYKQGYQEGERAARLELAEEIDAQKMIALETITQLVANFQSALHLLDEKIVPKLASIAALAAQKIIGQLPDCIHKQLVSIIQELINTYPPLGENIQLRVNPCDVSSIETLFANELAKYGWKLTIDAEIESGGCKLLSEKTEIDATLSGKWQAIMVAINKDNKIHESN